MNHSDKKYGISEREFEEMRDKVLEDLSQNLPGWLTYHSVLHTKNVIRDAEIIARHENVTEVDMMKIRIAALLHDTGFIETYQNHEEAGCVYARKILADFDISEDDINHICEMIMATKIPQSPMDHIGEILADADLAYLGTDQFEQISALLYAELKHLNPLFDLTTWNQIQIRFLTQHQYFTNYCNTTKSAVKASHVKKLVDGG